MMKKKIPLLAYDSIWIAILAIVFALIAIFSNPAQANEKDDKALFELIEAVEKVKGDQYDFYILPDDYSEEYIIEQQLKQIEV